VTGCQTRPVQSPELTHRSQPLLGTFVTISAWGGGPGEVQAAISAAFDEIRRADRIMSLHRADSELSRINATAATNAVPVSAELFRVLELAQQIAKETEGGFDVTLRPVTDLWGFIWKEHRLPTGAELAATLPRVGFQKVELDAGQQTVRFREPGVSLDLGGIGKGVAVDLAIARLRERGVTNAMVKAGGDLRVMGAPPGAAFWPVQLEDPRKQGRRVTIPLRDAALSTSGNYENFFEVGGRRYSHILDPRTGLPVEGIAACTVIAPTCAESDAWATALFVYGVDRSLADFGARLPMRFTLMPADAGAPVWTVRQTGSFPEVLAR
jgi:thiamine biosynthesis lipoprotein